MKNKLILLAIIFIIVEITLYVSVIHIRNTVISENTQSEIEVVQNSYKNSIGYSKDVSDILFNTVINTNGILRLFSEANNANDQQKDLIRQELYDRLKVMYKQQQSVGLAMLHFHLKDSTSFLRMHKPSEFGDSSKGIRQTIDYVNKYKKYIGGFEEGKVYNGYRFVYPLFYMGQYIGCVEMSISSNYMATKMNTLDNGIHDFIIKQSVIKSNIFPDELYTYVPSNIADEYLREIKSFEYITLKNAIFDSAEEYFNVFRLSHKQIEQQIGSEKPFVIHTLVNGKEITSVFMPVSNISHKKVAYFVSTFIDKKYQSIINLANAIIINGVVLLIIVFGFINMVMINIEKTKKLNKALDDQLHEHLEQLKFKEEILFQQSKLATLGEMFSALAHQWKQPLNILAMYIQNLSDDEALSEEEILKRTQIEDKCMAQINYMSETINDFMTFIRPAETIETKMDAVKTTEEIVKLLKPSMDKKKIDIKIKNDQNLKIYAKANSNEMKHILVNIINNAKDAIMDIKKDNKMFIGSIIISFDTTDDECIIKISDNGGGISHEIIGRIFMPYVSTKLQKEGSGLGLYMCAAIVKKYNGTLSVNNIDDGAVFTITIPLIK